MQKARSERKRAKSEAGAKEAGLNMLHIIPYKTQHSGLFIKPETSSRLQKLKERKKNVFYDLQPWSITLCITTDKLSDTKVTTDDLKET